MRIIITRPEEDALPLARKLEALGHEVVHLPLIRIVPRSDVKIPKHSYQAICITSANGVRNIDCKPLLHIPVLAVGPHSLEAARLQGFQIISMQGGDVVRLADYVATHLKVSAGKLLYLSGSETSGDLEGRLIAKGFAVDRIITYDALPAKFNAIAGDAVMLYSPRTAKIWRENIEQNNLDVSHMKHICLSANVAANLPQSWHTRVAAEPNENAILQVLD
jgi:uroporphyrinogen-III synthase